jgi:hypothetical protein
MSLHLLGMSANWHRQCKHHRIPKILKRELAMGKLLIGLCIVAVAFVVAAACGGKTLERKGIVETKADPFYLFLDSRPRFA